MKKQTLKSIGAILAGFVTGAVLSVLTDTIFEKAGWMQTKPFDANPAWLIVVVVVYRTIYGVLGAYIAGRMAPNSPIKHAMILGVAGFIVSVAGTIVMWDVPPHWYPIALDILALPTAWLGGLLATQKQNLKTI